MWSAHDVSRRRLGGSLTFFLIWLGVTVVGASLTPSPDGHGTHQRLGLPPCPSALLLNRPCPGCGLTTSWTALLHGNFDLAFRAHALGPPLFLAFTLAAWWNLFGWILRKRISADGRAFQRVLMGGVVVFMTYGAARFTLTTDYRTPTESAMLRMIPR